MRLRFLINNGLLTLVLLAAWGSQGVRAAGGPHAEKIEFSEPMAESPVMVSNLSRLNDSPSTFKQVKEDLLRPFGSLDPRNSLQGFGNEPLPQPQRPFQAGPNKRTQEMLDKRRNWAFTSYQDLFAPKTAEEMFGVKDGREKATAVDTFYNSLGQKNSLATNHDSSSMENARAEFINRNGFDPLGSAFQGSDPFMKKMFAANPTQSTTEKETGGLFKTVSNYSTSSSGVHDEVAPPNKRLDEIRRSIFGDSARVAKPAGIGSVLSEPDDYFSRASKTSAESLLNQQMSQAAELRKNNGNPYLAADPTANVLHSHVNDDLTARALGLPNPVPARVLEPAKAARTAQSVATETSPFAGSRPKPRF